MFLWYLITEDLSTQDFSFPVTRCELQSKILPFSPISKSHLKSLELAYEDLVTSPAYILKHFDLLFSALFNISNIPNSIFSGILNALIGSGLEICDIIFTIANGSESILLTSKQKSILSTCLMKLSYLISELFFEKFPTSSQPHNQSKNCYDSKNSGIDVFFLFERFFELSNQLLSAEIQLIYSPDSVIETIRIILSPSYLIFGFPPLLKRFSPNFLQSICSSLNKYPSLFFETGIKVTEVLLSSQQSIPPYYLKPEIQTLFEKLIHQVPNFGCQIVREILSKIQLDKNSSGFRILGPVLAIVLSYDHFIVEDCVNFISPLLSSDCHLIRIGALVALTQIIRNIFNFYEGVGNQSYLLNVASNNFKNSLLNNLIDHMFDINAFVRSRCICLITSLWENGIFPINMQTSILEMFYGRLSDSSALVRKQTFSSLVVVLQKNPFNTNILNINAYEIALEREINTLKEMEESYDNLLYQLEYIDTQLNSDIEELIESNEDIFSIELDPQGSETYYSRFSSEIAIGFIPDCIAALDLLKRHKPGHCIFRHQRSDERSIILSLSKQDLLALSTILRISKQSDKSKDPWIQIESQKQKVHFLQCAIKFIELIHVCFPNALSMLNSKVSSDVTSSISFLMEYRKYKLPDYLASSTAIFSLISSQQLNYQEIAMNTFMEFFELGSDLNHPIFGQYPSIVQTLCENIFSNVTYVEFYTNRHIVEMLAQHCKFPSDFCNVLLQLSIQTHLFASNFQNKILMLICMIGKGNPKFLYDNIDFIISVCFTKNLMDLEIGRLGCYALNIICSGNILADHHFSRLFNSHQIFSSIQLFLSSKLTDYDSDWTSFMFESMLLILQLARAPLIMYINCISNCSDIVNMILDERIRLIGITRFLMLIGRVAQLHIVLMENIVCTSEKSLPDNISGLIVPRQEVEYEDLEIIDRLDISDAIFTTNYSILEELVHPHGFFTRYVPILIQILKSQSFIDFAMIFKNNHLDHSLPSISQLQCSAVFALCQFMLLSVCLCELYIELLISLMALHHCPYLRNSCICAVSDLILRYPSTLQPWVPYLYKALRDLSTMVRKQAILIICHLVHIDIIKIQGNIAEIAFLLKDQDSSICQIALQFFSTISKNGNILYNALPDILSNMLDIPNRHFTTSFLKQILKILFSYIQKEKQIDNLIEKLLLRMKSAISNDEVDLIAYSIALLPHSERTLIIIISQFSHLKMALQDESIKSNFISISTIMHRKSKLFPAISETLYNYDNLLKTL
ncbi:Condensin complex subunit 1 isoform X1 [Oopsacas minuta]|uniref:Condensin complex subunit 1 isoform X1 n=1 Tax=Oopsacas minuta TaxID=111878 RepID=A0AAV7JS78_9METZ|nr:Condensin complex subunit 1 isoform X1 [Oopsacas minuta]